MSRADARGHNKSHFSVLEFFVELDRFNDLLARKILRQFDRQLEFFEKISNRITLIRRQANLLSGDRARSDNSKTQRFAVKEFPIFSCALNGVANCVTKIQKRALASLVALVLATIFDLISMLRFISGASL
jgi:hypothetical protein